MNSVNGDINLSEISDGKEVFEKILCVEWINDVSLRGDFFGAWVDADKQHLVIYYREIYYLSKGKSR